MMKALYVVSRAMSSGPVNQALNVLTGMKLNNSVDDILVTIDKNKGDDNWIDRFYDKGINVVQLNIGSKYRLVKAVRELR